MVDTYRERVAALAAGEGCLTDRGRVLDVLACRDSFDVQACPGSGKTTTVAAKIVVFLDDWRGSSGLCVLTHTNVAREEIQRKLRASTLGRAALDSPHFIGTIQKFTDSFLAIPYLRATGAIVEQVDNDAFESAVEAEYRRGSYHSFKAWLKNNNGKNQLENTRYRLLEYAALSKDITFNGKPTGLKDPLTPSRVEMGKLKEKISARGIYRHGDMYHFANQYLDRFPWAIEVLRKRFSVVIIDEMQDTSGRQEALLERIFPPDRIVVQRFGDDNQKIFDMDSEGEATSFPRAPVFPLGESRRFGAFIARNISLIAPRVQAIFGEPTVDELRHAIFLFDGKTIGNVIPRFAMLARDELKDIDAPLVIKAIGHRKQLSSGNLPNHLGDYFSGFAPDALASVVGPEGLRLRVERAKLAMRLDPFAGPSQVLTAIRLLIRCWASAKPPQIILRQLLGDKSTRRRLGEIVQALLGSESADSDAWQAIVESLLSVLAKAIGDARPAAASAFAAWCEVSSPLPVVSAPSNLSLPVSIQTIHSVKGESHHATLVLETYYYNHDVSRMLPFLADAAKPLKNLSARATMDHRRMFVAMSRPRNLLCLAAEATRVNESLRVALRGKGWSIIDLTHSRVEE